MCWGALRRDEPELCYHLLHLGNGNQQPFTVRDQRRESCYLAAPSLAHPKPGNLLSLSFHCSPSSLCSSHTSLNWLVPYLECFSFFGLIHMHPLRLSHHVSFHFQCSYSVVYVCLVIWTSLLLSPVIICRIIVCFTWLYHKRGNCGCFVCSISSMPSAQHNGHDTVSPNSYLG